MIVWIDTDSGTYGDLDSIVFVELPEDTLDKMDYGELSDQQIAQIGHDHHENATDVPVPIRGNGDFLGDLTRLLHTLSRPELAHIEQVAFDLLAASRKVDL